MIRRDCRYLLRYASRDFCKRVWVENICAEAKELSLGCDLEGSRCLHYTPLKWKRGSLPPAEQETLEVDEAEVLEWDDDEENTRNELPPTTGSSEE